MNITGIGTFLSIKERQYKGKTYHNVNIDFDGEIRSIGTREPQNFTGLPAYSKCRFNMRFNTYQNRGYIVVDSAEVMK